MYRRPVFARILERLKEPRRFLQVLAGPRQTGKTTLARQLMQALDAPAHYASADMPGTHDPAWIALQWEQARRLLASSPESRALLVLDEVQKVPGWADAVKALWDEDTAAGRELQVLLLGSSPLLVQRGVRESLAGRFELIPIRHWSYAEMRDAFGFSLEDFIPNPRKPDLSPFFRVWFL